MNLLRHLLTACLPGSESNHERPSFQSLSSVGPVYVKHVVHRFSPKNRLYPMPATTVYGVLVQGQYHD
jgi:hypothetical protein